MGSPFQQKNWPKCPGKHLVVPAGDPILVRYMRAVSVVALVAVNCWVVTAATFHKDVEPLLERHCQGCHHAGDIGPMPLQSYEQVRPWAKAIRAAVLQK